MFNWFKEKDNKVVNLPELLIKDRRSTSSIDVYKGKCHCGYITYIKGFGVWMLKEVHPVLRNGDHPGFFPEELRQIADKIDELNSENK
jgi:hypothetical protein